MPFDPEDNVFLLAGPIKMHARVLRAMARPAINHRGPEFAKLSKELGGLLQAAFQTSWPVLPITGSGTAGLEAAVGAVVGPQDKVLAVANGNFGERMGALAELYGQVTVLKHDWGLPYDLTKVEATIREQRPKAVVLTHNETSAGITNPLERLTKAAHEAGALVIADCITSIGGIDVPVERWGVDLAVTGSQKALGAPPGLAFVSVGPRAREAMKSVKARTLYLNLQKTLDKWEKDNYNYPTTPATHLYFAAIEGLRLLQEQTLPGRFAKVRATAEATRDAAKALGLQLLPPPGHESDTVTAMRYPVGIEDAKFRGALKDKHGVVVSGGQGPVKGKIFRIGTMGTVDFRDLAAGFAAIEAELAAQGHKVEQGAGVAAIERAMVRA
ncbi:MAG TPA: alanine--glyoxylate aminotransferase family protein [Candidatus Thermoplasmatota archaeon]|jgi:aspartate aminotransferase-like enzyme|nr:alanine--glyoxylate aminotransferase family protein [Candidatus Thermoplasmatota archaeon]